jgi:hypothetical protein
MAVNFTTPRGRIVQGDVYKRSAKTDSLGKPKLGADGKPEMQYFVALAVPKNDPNWPAFFALLNGEARAAWPQFFNAAGQCTNPTFATKITDGDGHDQKGQSHATKEGFAGHWVVKCASMYAPKVFEHTGLGWTETADGRVKRGDYARISGTTSSNQSAVSPGMYVNLNMVAYEGEGAAIVSGPTADQAFGTPGAAAPVASPPPPPGVTPPPPPAASTGPVMTAAAGGATYAAMIAAGWTDATLIAGRMMVPPTVAPVVAPPPLATGAPTSPIAPAGNAPLPPPHAGYMAAPSPPAGPTMTAAANGVPYESYIANGWTHAQLVASGMVVA